MTECVHTGQSTDAAADDGGGYQGGFRDPPKVFLGTALVRKHKKEGAGIDYKKIDQNESHGFDLSGGDCMKKILVFLVAGCLLAGCGTQETMETISDEQTAQVLAQQRRIYVELPGDAASPAVESDSGRLYLCGDYEISIQILDGGDTDATVKCLSGYEPGALTIMETQREGICCREFVWVSAGETGDLVGRAMVMDDGSYHYCLSVLADADTAQQNQAVWDRMFDSFRLA